MLFMYRVAVRIYNILTYPKKKKKILTDPCKGECHDVDAPASLNPKFLELAINP